MKVMMYALKHANSNIITVADDDAFADNWGW